ncbi:MAG: hypothetical protein H0T86_15580 [Gemmatimonadales bacterium]|nr:hypothetical protein [Gemmatimonadales bacterium]
MTIRVYVGYSHLEVERFLRGGSKCETTGVDAKSRALRDHVAGYLRLADGTGFGRGRANLTFTVLDRTAAGLRPLLG